MFAFLKLFFKISWCDHVMDTPDDNRMIVFKSGIFIGLNASIELGGHIWPISILGLIPL
jgi:hypothetical protein